MSRDHKRPMLAFVVVALACAVLVVNAARSSAVDLLRGPLPSVAAAQSWRLLPGGEALRRDDTELVASPAEPGMRRASSDGGRSAARGSQASDQQRSDRRGSGPASGPGAAADQPDHAGQDGQGSNGSNGGQGGQGGQGSKGSKGGKGGKGSKGSHATHPGTGGHAVSAGSVSHGLGDQTEQHAGPGTAGDTQASFGADEGTSGAGAGHDEGWSPEGRSDDRSHGRRSHGSRSQGRQGEHRQGRGEHAARHDRSAERGPHHRHDR